MFLSTKFINRISRPGVKFANHYHASCTSTGQKVAFTKKVLRPSIEESHQCTSNFSKYSSRLYGHTVKRFTNNSAKNKDTQQKLKWTERDEAPQWIQKMAPSKGGTALPNRLEATVISIVFILGYYAWFVDPGSWLVDNNEDNDAADEVSSEKVEERQSR